MADVQRRVLGDALRRRRLAQVPRHGPQLLVHDLDALEPRVPGPEELVVALLLLERRPTLKNAQDFFAFRVDAAPLRSFRPQ